MSLLKVNEVQNYNGSSLTLTASTVSTSAQLNTGGNISVTGSINVSDDSTTRSNLGLGTMATQNANAVAITGGTINTVQPASGQSLTIKDEDGNTAITVGTDNTATGYLSLNFGSYHGGSGTLTGNTLDSYEEGAFNPTVFIDSTEVTSYHFQYGNYTKVGRIVHINLWVRVNAKGAATGSVSVQGLPFICGSGNAFMTAGTIGYQDEMASSSAPIYVYITQNTTKINLNYASSTTLTNVTNANLNNGQFMIQVSYSVA